MDDVDDVSDLLAKMFLSVIIESHKFSVDVSTVQPAVMWHTISWAKAQTAIAIDLLL